MTLTEFIQKILDIQAEKCIFDKISTMEVKFLADSERWLHSDINIDVRQKNDEWFIEISEKD